MDTEKITTDYEKDVKIIEKGESIITAFGVIGAILIMRIPLTYLIIGSGKQDIAIMTLKMVLLTLFFIIGGKVLTEGVKRFFIKKNIIADEFITDKFFYGIILRYGDYYATNTWYIQNDNNFDKESDFSFNLIGHKMKISERQFVILKRCIDNPSMPILILTKDEYDTLLSGNEVNTLQIGTV